MLWETAEIDLLAATEQRERLFLVTCHTSLFISDEFEMRFRSVWLQRLPRFAINRHAAEIPFL